MKTKEPRGIVVQMFIDPELLKTQRYVLGALLDRNPDILNKEEHEALEGINGIMEAIADQAYDIYDMDTLWLGEDDSVDDPNYINYYKCPCGTEWKLVHSCKCNDRCHKCNKEIVPYKSEDIVKEE